MGYTLEQLAVDCRAAVDRDSGPAGRAAVLECVKKACVDEDFVAQYIGPGNDAERKIIYEDPAHGFCILTHVYKGSKSSGPHDHGPSWAIYGQVEGETEMSDYRVIESPANGKPGKAEKTRTYTLKPGDAHIYEIGELHSPERYSNTRLLRVEGMNMDKVKRDRFELA